MYPESLDSNGHSDDKQKLSGSIGNASNPNPDDGFEPGHPNQLLDEKAEKYLREVASIEDLPDEEDQQDMDKAIRDNKNDNS